MAGIGYLDIGFFIYLVYVDTFLKVRLVRYFDIIAHNVYNAH